MQHTSILLISILVISSILLFGFQSNGSDELQNPIFENWKSQFAKHYNNVVEQTYRCRLFDSNYKMVQEHNLKYQAGEELMKMALNQFSDLTHQEFAEMYLNADLNIHVNADFACNGPQAPDQAKFEANFTLNASMINPIVLTQGACASGYAIATVGAVQSSMYKILKQFKQMSPQQLIDCTKQMGNTGCEGGNSLNSLHYLINKGAMKESDYPYTSKTGSCAYNAGKKVWQIDNCTKVASDVTKLKSAIFQQPIIVGFDAKTDSKFISYGAGLYTAPLTCGSGALNHYMLATGWGQITTKGTLQLKSTTSYYLVVKNSFGLKWGNNGYLNIVYQTVKGTDKPENNNACGILKDVYFPYG